MPIEPLGCRRSPGEIDTDRSSPAGEEPVASAGDGEPGETADGFVPGPFPLPPTNTANNPTATIRTRTATTRNRRSRSRRFASGKRTSVGSRDSSGCGEPCGGSAAAGSPAFGVWIIVTNATIGVVMTPVKPPEYDESGLALEAVDR